MYHLCKRTQNYRTSNLKNCTNKLSSSVAHASWLSCSNGLETNNHIFHKKPFFAIHIIILPVLGFTWSTIICFIFFLDLAALLLDFPEQGSHPMTLSSSISFTQSLDFYFFFLQKQQYLQSTHFKSSRKDSTYFIKLVEDTIKKRPLIITSEISNQVSLLLLHIIFILSSFTFSVTNVYLPGNLLFKIYLAIGSDSLLGLDHFSEITRRRLVGG